MKNTTKDSFKHLDHIYEVEPIVEIVASGSDLLSDLEEISIRAFKENNPATATVGTQTVPQKRYKGDKDSSTGLYKHPLYPNNITTTQTTYNVEGSGVEEYEGMLNITVDRNYTAEYRKTRVRRQIGNKTRYTMNYLKKFFETWGIENVSFNFSASSPYELEVGVSPTELAQAEEINRLLDLFIPMNIHYTRKEEIGKILNLNDIVQVDYNYWQYPLKDKGTLLSFSSSHPFLSSKSWVGESAEEPYDDTVSLFCTCMQNLMNNTISSEPIVYNAYSSSSATAVALSVTTGTATDTTFGVSVLVPTASVSTIQRLQAVLSDGSGGGVSDANVLYRTFDPTLLNTIDTTYKLAYTVRPTTTPTLPSVCTYQFYMQKAFDTSDTFSLYINNVLCGELSNGVDYTKNIHYLYSTITPTVDTDITAIKIVDSDDTVILNRSVNLHVFKDAPFTVKYTLVPDIDIQ